MPQVFREPYITGPPPSVVPGGPGQKLRLRRQAGLQEQLPFILAEYASQLPAHRFRIVRVEPVGDVAQAT